jgi:imidazole glycerol-phosphate synthase subunit HisH
VIDLIDYGGGNIGSIERCLDRLALPYSRLDATEMLPSGNNAVILPGVGSFGSVMRALNETGLTQRLRHLINEGIPYLGICVGMQVLFEHGEEAADMEGLGLLKGSVRKFKAAKVPQIGWNEVIPRQPAQRGFAYFVNSYYCDPEDPGVILYEAHYEGAFCAAIHHSNMTAFQFHPEKSGHFGHQLIQRWFDAQ